MKIRTLAIVLVAVPLLAYGSVKLYLNSRIDDLMTRLAEGPLRPVATLRWGDIETTLSGEASVHDIRLDLRRPADTITIERITYDTPNIWYLMRDLGDVQNNRVPSSLHLRTEGVRLDLYGELTEQLEQVINELNLDLAGVSKLCGGRLFMGPRELRDMGYDAVIFDADAGIDIDNITEEITWSLQLAARNAFAIQLKTTIDGFLGTPLQDQVPTPHKPRVGPTRVRVADRGYVERVVTYCARLSEMGIGEYIEEEAGQPAAYFANLWGIVPGPGLREAYRRYLADPRDIEVSLSWPEDVTPDGLALFNPEDIPQMLELQVKVNGDPVTDLAFAFYQGRRTAFGSRFRRLFLDDEPRKVVQRKPRIRYEKRYHPIDINHLGDYLDHEVRLYTEQGQRREGTLTKVSGNTAYVEQSIHHGQFTMQVPLSKVSKAEVLLRTPVESGTGN